MKIVIVGCTHAGTAAAAQILQNHPEAELTIYERNDNISFLSCGIYLYLGGKVNRLEDMFYSSPEALTKLGATVKTKHNVLKIDAENKTLQVADMETGDVFDDTYDKLIMTTGSSVKVPPIFGIDESKVLLCKNYDQAREIYKTAKDNQRIAIVGAGYIGTELSESYANTNHEVTLFQSHDQILNHYISKDMSDRAVTLLKEHGVNVKLNHRVSAFTGNDKGELVIETNQGDFIADLAIVGTGFVPVTELLRGQVEMDKHGAIVINDYVQTSDPDIYAAGDPCVQNFNPTGEAAYTPLATNAVRQGALAGINIFGNLQRYMGTQATSAMQLFDHTLATTGLTYDIAKLSHVPVERVVFEGNWRPAYMETTDPLTIELTYNPENRKILGAQLWSPHEIAQSANALSIAIQNGNTIDDLAFVDMLFSPNFDDPFNYLNVVGQMAVAQERENGRDNPRITAIGNWEEQHQD
ncbi:FAD-dependent oxidoreductase [Lactiplantibacillus mudanjiangensis]|uniref:NADH oxidase [Lactobacillus sp.] n=1 Tax=Lactiplantibacillus mudanjiangensis TaxID=1296538 RepID=A0A660E5M6_9LACO|nr:FAD-dependent oxidoreductase [Lactiplantibacillus mudanjiangensis]VDG24360.1 NADH oxidase [Lactobacillus sp.] [Lactiplantibacillus mudanjiangensis]VDG28347.1 NADH oxidase [Lactobacillus sp.] [Lactiplantibacillus mudanjiangensis]